MYIDELPKNLQDATKLRVRCDSCGKESKKPMAWVNARNNFQINGGKHILRCCTMSGKNNPACRPEVREQMKKTSLERYGVSCALNQPDKVAERVKKMFGTETAKQEIVEKRKKTSRERYGADHIMKTQEGMDRVKEAIQEKYGVDFPLQNAEIMEKTQRTNMERYGVKNVAAVPEVRIKMAQTTLEKYGVEHYNQLPEMKDYLRGNCREWLAESYTAGGPNKGIVRPAEWNRKQRETVRQRMLDGRWCGGFKSNCKGRYPAAKCKKQMPQFLSTLELLFHFHLNDDSNVEWYDYEGIVIEYKQQDGSDHDYYPDFLVKYYDDPVLRIVETKTYRDKDSITVQLKQEAAIDYADSHNMVYVLLFDEDVAALNIDVEKTKAIPGIIFYPTK